MASETTHCCTSRPSPTWQCRQDALGLWRRTLPGCTKQSSALHVGQFAVPMGGCVPMQAALHIRKEGPIILSLNVFIFTCTSNSYPQRSKSLPSKAEAIDKVTAISPRYIACRLLPCLGFTFSMALMKSIGLSKTFWEASSNLISLNLWSSRPWLWPLMKNERTTDSTAFKCNSHDPYFIASCLHAPVGPTEIGHLCIGNARRHSAALQRSGSGQGSQWHSHFDPSSSRIHKPHQWQQRWASSPVFPSLKTPCIYLCSINGTENFAQSIIPSTVITKHELLSLDVFNVIHCTLPPYHISPSVTENGVQMSSPTTFASDSVTDCLRKALNFSHTWHFACWDSPRKRITCSQDDPRLVWRRSQMR